MAEIDYESTWWALIYDQYNSGLRKKTHEKELSFYSSELARCKGPVLEVACGTGMILLELLERDIDIYGFDISAAMLDMLYRKAADREIQDIRHRVTRQNMADFKYDQLFDAIFIPASSFMMLTTQEEQIACLKKVHAHLKVDGRFLLNFFIPDFEKDILGHAEASDHYGELGDFVHPDTGETIVVTHNQVSNIAEQTERYIWKFTSKDSEHEVPMHARWIYKEEFQLLLRLAGFRTWKLYGDFDRSEYRGRGKQESLIWIVEK